MSRDAKVFVSFQREQEAAARKLVQFLEAAGHRCWHMDDNRISGTNWQAEIRKGIDWCSDLVLLFGPESDGSKHVQRELNLADSRDKTIHWLRLTDTQPDKLEYVLALVNGVDWFDQQVAPAELLKALAPARQSQRPSSREDDEVDHDPDSTEVVTLFVDRLPERDALRQSLEAHLRETSADELPAVNNNLLTFYGVGGQGKSRLSRRLERWLQGKLPAEDHWGQPPRTAHTVRWNLDQSQDRPQLLGFLQDFWRMLADTGHRFPEFDLAFAAFYFKAAGDIGDDRTLRPLEGELLWAVDDLAELIGMTGSSDALTTRRLRRLLAADQDRDEPVFQRPAELEQLLRLIADRGDSLDSWQHVVALMMDNVNRRLHQLPPQERPTIAVFVDTFEAVQNPERLAGEQIINALIANLPLCLFVVTGRERITWHEPDSHHVRWGGADRWPSLSRIGPTDALPRQHELAYLSPEDAEDALRHALAEVNWQLSARELSELAAETQGWPLHVEILVNLIRERSTTPVSDGLQFGDLLGSFPALVRRLLQHLPHDVQMALQAAAVAPSFDRDSLRLCDSAIKAGTVTRLLRTSLVGRSEDPFFPYKLHDELRHAVVAAGSSVPGGWEDEDRLAAAENLVNGLAAQWGQAKAAESHTQMMHIHAMGVRLCLHYGLDVEWAKKAFLSTPSHKYQRDLLPNVDRVRSDDELLELVRVYRALGLENRPERLAQLRQISLHATSDRVRFRADLWTMYGVRGMDPAPAVELSRALLEDPYNRNCGSWEKPGDLVRAQYGFSLSGTGRWTELQKLDPERTLPAWNTVAHVHGRFEEAAAGTRRRLQKHLDAGKSYRFAMELLSSAIQRSVLAGEGLRLEEFNELAMHASRYDVAWVRLRVAATIAPWLATKRPELINNLWCESTERQRMLKTESARRTRAAFALKVAMAGGSTAFVREAQQDYIDRPGASVHEAPYEFLFDAVGLPIPSQQVSWLEDVDVVRQRWLDGWQHTLTPPPGWEYSEELYG